MRSNSQGWSGGPRERKPGTGADYAVVERRSVCRVRRICFRHRFGSCTLIHAGGSFVAVKADGDLVLFRDGGKGPVGKSGTGASFAVIRLLTHS